MSQIEEDKDLAKKPKPSEEPKFCPIIGRDCLKDACALWVDIVKDSSHPFYYGEYHGCGLTQHIPYKIKRREL